MSLPFLGGPAPQTPQRRGHPRTPVLKLVGCKEPSLAFLWALACGQFLECILDGWHVLICHPSSRHAPSRAGSCEHTSLRTTRPLCWHPSARASAQASIGTSIGIGIHRDHESALASALASIGTGIHRLWQRHTATSSALAFIGVGIGAGIPSALASALSRLHSALPSYYRDRTTRLWHSSALASAPRLAIDSCCRSPRSGGASGEVVPKFISQKRKTQK